MKKIINGKLYNTETAEMVGEYEKGRFRNDSGWYREELYRKRTGEFFLFGEGGGTSKYSAYLVDAKDDGSKIIKLSIGEVKSWMEEHESVESYIEIFGDVEE